MCRYICTFFPHVLLALFEFVSPVMTRIASKIMLHRLNQESLSHNVLLAFYRQEPKESVRVLMCAVARGGIVHVTHEELHEKFQT